MLKTKSRIKASNITRHKRLKSATLMRSGVRKPNPTLKRQIHISHELAHDHKIVPAYRQVAAKQHKRSHIKKSQLIAHFNKDLLTQPNFSYTPSQVISPHDKHEPKTIKAPDQPKNQLDILLDRGLNNAQSHLNVSVVQNDKTEVIYGSLIILVILGAFLFLR